MAPLRTIKKIIIHCTGTDIIHTTKDIRLWHRKRNFADIGYHFIIEKFSTDNSAIGQISIGRPIQLVGAHCLGNNHDSIGICLVGENNFNNRQFYSLSKLLSNLLVIFSLDLDDIYPHNFYNKNKSCPNFDLENFKEKYMGELWQKKQESKKQKN